MDSADLLLKQKRQRLELSFKDVEDASRRIAEKYRNDEFVIPVNVLRDIEVKSFIPTVRRMYSLSIIYRMDIRELLGWYGMDLQNLAEDIGLAQLSETHPASVLSSTIGVELPLEMDPSFDPTRSVDIARMISKWGAAPFTYLQRFALLDCAYGYVGTNDQTMYPLIPPGSFVQVDKQKTEVTRGPWRNIFERPIYFVDTGRGYRCCWCAQDADDIVLIGHPMSQQAPKALPRDDVRIIGQVVGVAFKFSRETERNGCVSV